MNKTSLSTYIKSDLFRYTGTKFSYITFLKHYINKAGFRYSFWFRCASYFSFSNKVICFYCKYRLRHYMFKYGIEIPPPTHIDMGFYIGHFGGIIINSEVKIGKNVNISQGVTIGLGGRAEKRGCPVIGNNVYIGPGVKIFGKIKIGNNVAIGANAVVTKDILDNSVVVGIPGKIISDKGATDFVHNII